MARPVEEDGFERRTRLAFERACKVRKRVRERGNRVVMRNELWFRRFGRDFYRKYRRVMEARGIELEDVIQAAALGSVIASRFWSPKRGAFTGHAWYRMRKECLRLVKQHRDTFFYLFEDRRGNLDVASKYAPPDEEADERIRIERINSIVSQFPGSYGDVLEDWLTGVSALETAGRLRCSRNRVYRKRWLALEWLQHRLGMAPRPERQMGENPAKRREETA
jgi:hypothetical protein